MEKIKLWNSGIPGRRTKSALSPTGTSNQNPPRHDRRDNYTAKNSIVKVAVEMPAIYGIRTALVHKFRKRRMRSLSGDPNGVGRNPMMDVSRLTRIDFPEENPGIG